MKFVDYIQIPIKAGKGGDGAIAFRRESHVARGGPEGGDGGRGGSIYFVGDSGLNTLVKVKLMTKLVAQNGQNGRKKNQYGAKGEDLIIKVPFGTLVYEGQRLICDVIESDHRYLIARGGQGGKGNTHFKSSRNQAPRLSEKGLLGEEFLATLQLKVLADIGFVGQPSAGKSTLLAQLTKAKTKIGAYDFTTINPQLGVLKAKNQSLVLADLPGLIKGAAHGKGLGQKFLKHIERAKVIVYIIDFGSLNHDPICDYEQITTELDNYLPQLKNRVQLIIANKADLSPFANNFKRFKQQFPNLNIISISALKVQNLTALKRMLIKIYHQAPSLTYEVDRDDEITITLKPAIIINQPIWNLFEVSGSEVEKIYHKIPLTTQENINRFNKKMQDLGLWQELRTKGIKHGDIVRILSYEFTWNEQGW